MAARCLTRAPRLVHAAVRQPPARPAAARTSGPGAPRPAAAARRARGRWPSRSPAPAGCATSTAWIAETHGTSLLVLDGGGSVVHEWYADGRRPETLFLGASMTKSVLAHLVGLAVRRGRPRRSTTASWHSTCPSSPTPATPAAPSRPADDDHRRRLGGGPPRPDRPGHPADRLLRRRRRRLPRAAGRGRAREPPGHAVGVLHRRLPGARLGARARHRHDVRRGAGRAVAHARLHPRRRRRHRLRRRRAGRRQPGRDRAATGPGSGCSSSTAPRRRAGARRGLGGRLAPVVPVPAPGRLPSCITTHAGFGYHWWPLDDEGGGPPPTAAAASSPTSTAISASSCSRPRCGPTTTS